PSLTTAGRVGPVTGRGRAKYEQRVNRVVDHIREHLADELSLVALARLAAFSPFHFHRLFRAITGETLFGFIQRQRVERAGVVLYAHPDLSVLAVGLDHGFSSAATFARDVPVALRDERDSVAGRRRRALATGAGARAQGGQSTSQAGPSTARARGAA